MFKSSCTPDEFNTYFDFHEVLPPEQKTDCQIAQSFHVGYDWTPQDKARFLTLYFSFNEYPGHAVAQASRFNFGLN